MVTKMLRSSAFVPVQTSTDRKAAASAAASDSSLTTPVVVGLMEGSDPDDEGAREGEVWLWQHKQRNASTKALAAAALHPELYSFAATLRKEKVKEDDKKRTD
jgi:hypothetical protein